MLSSVLTEEKTHLSKQIETDKLPKEAKDKQKKPENIEEKHAKEETIRLTPEENKYFIECIHTYMSMCVCMYLYVYTHCT